MNHLTTNEVLQFVDGAIANGVRTKLMEHLEVCPRCRAEVEFQRNLLRAAKAAPLARPSREFTASVLDAVSHQTKKTWSTTIVNNLGRVLAMAMVLSVVWYVLNAPRPAQNSTPQSVLSTIVHTYVDYYAQAQNFVSNQKVRIIGEPTAKEGTGTDHVIILTVISILILVVVDRFVVRRVIKIRA